MLAHLAPREFGVPRSGSLRRCAGAARCSPRAGARSRAAPPTSGCAGNVDAGLGSPAEAARSPPPPVRTSWKSVFARNQTSSRTCQATAAAVSSSASQAAPRDHPEQLLGLAKPSELIVTDPPRSELGRKAFELRANLIGLANLAGRRAADKRPTMRNQLDNAVRLQLAQRLPHRRPTHTELRRKRLLPQPRADGIAPAITRVWISPASSSTSVTSDRPNEGRGEFDVIS